MTTSGRALLKETQKELQKWKVRYSTLYQEKEQLYQENKQLKAVMATCVGNDEPSVKRQRLEIPTNPLELPEPCAMRILQFLPRNDLLKATEVSKQWKRYIESRSKLMKRAMNGTVVNINFDRTKLAEVISSQFQREYKHMKISFSSHRVPSTFSSSVLYPAIKISSMLETLCVLLYFDVYEEFFEQKFPNLVKLELRCDESPFEKVPKFPFPELTTLKIESIGFARSALSTDRFEQFFRAFPKLQHLQIKNVDVDFVYRGSIPELIVEDPAQPKLKTIVFSGHRYFPKFLRIHQNSLTKVLMGYMSTLNLSLCLRDLKQLKSLTVGSLHRNRTDQEIAFPQNESIESLTIGRNYLNSDLFHQTLTAFPSLEKLAVKYSDKYYSAAVDIRFLAANMINLKWYKAGEITDKDLEVYNEVKQNANQYINTSFELAYDRDVDYDSFEELQI